MCCQQEAGVHGGGGGPTRPPERAFVAASVIPGQVTSSVNPRKPLPLATYGFLLCPFLRAINPPCPPPLLARIFRKGSCGRDLRRWSVGLFGINGSLLHSPRPPFYPASVAGATPGVLGYRVCGTRFAGLWMEHFHFGSSHLQARAHRLADDRKWRTTVVVVPASRRRGLLPLEDSLLSRMFRDA